MKTIIGIDTGHAYEPAVRLFARLHFAGAQTKLLNVADLVLPYTSFGVPPTLEATNEFVEGLKQAGKHAVRQASELAASYGLETETEVVAGPVTLSLLDEADNEQADLLAVASTRKGPLAALFTGSVSRSIAVGSKHNVLVAKEGVKNEGPVDVVIATDHSAYAERAIDRLLALRPKGIGHVHVVTAYEIGDHEAEILHANLPALGSQVDIWVEEKLRERSIALVGKLSQFGYMADFVLEKGDPNRVITANMQRLGAELLIVGAQGHGFFDRLFVGSVSFHQLVAEPYSVLVMRG